MTLNKQTSVTDLIEKLKMLNQTDKVILQGCDCINDWNGEITKENDSITLEITL